VVSSLKLLLIPSFILSTFCLKTESPRPIAFLTRCVEALLSSNTHDPSLGIPGDPGSGIAGSGRSSPGGRKRVRLGSSVFVIDDDELFLRCDAVRRAASSELRFSHTNQGG
jgi:hypothetical protein